jgi:ribonuclease HII
MRALEIEAWRAGHRVVAGADEAGRGPLAGPVVAAAVILPEDFDDIRVTDSKKLTASQRDLLYDTIYAEARSVGIGILDPPEIDRVNILRAALAAMAMAVQNLCPAPDFLLVDGTFATPLSLPQKAVKKGDSLSYSIAAASIVAKVTRDRLMERYDLEYPGFGFAKHKGYPTEEHREALLRLGPCPIHRKSFCLAPRPFQPTLDFTAPARPHGQQA